jgi:hypothetical protein
MGDMNFPKNPEIGEPHLGWSWDGEKWVLSGSETSGITTADVKLTNPQRASFQNQEDANQYFYDSIEAGGDVDLSDYYTKPESDNKFQVKGNYLTEFTEEDPTVPPHVKSITTSDISKWNNPPTGGGGGIPEAPSDNNIYGRKNSGWVVVPTSGGGGGTDLSAYYTKTESDAKYQLKGSYAASNHNHNGVYQPVGNYATTSYSYSKAESDGKYALKGSGGGSSTDTLDDVCKRGASTGTSPAAANWWTRSNTYTLGGVDGKGARIISYDGVFVFYKADGSETNRFDSGNVNGTSFTSNVNNKNLVTVYGNAIANAGSNGAGLYFSDNAGSKSITPCRGTDFAEVNNVFSLGNPNYNFSKVYSTTFRGAQRSTQNNGDAVLSVTDLIDVMQDLRDATKDEKTVDGLRDSIGDCVGGIIEKLEAIQADAKESLEKEIEEFEKLEAQPTTED